VADAWTGKQTIIDFLKGQREGTEERLTDWRPSAVGAEAMKMERPSVGRCDGRDLNVRV